MEAHAEHEVVSRVLVASCAVCTLSDQKPKLKKPVPGHRYLISLARDMCARQFIFVNLYFIFP
jgi:hypothetical protein